MLSVRWGKARRRRYDESPKGRERTRRWRKSSKGRRAIHSYNASPKGQAKRERSLAKARGATQPSGRITAVPMPEVRRPERDVRRLTAADFSGPCYREVGSTGGRPRNGDELISRYHKLRNS